MDKHIIKKAIENIINSSNPKKDVIEIYTKRKNDAMNMKESPEKNGALKELTGIINSNEIEVALSTKNKNIIIDEVVELIYNYEEYKEIFEPLYKISKTDKYLCEEIIQKIINTKAFLEIHKDRFLLNNKQKQKDINNLNKSIDIANKYNNQHLVNELNSMITFIKNENYITEEIIYKNCFFVIHKHLYDISSDYTRTTKAVDIANSIVSDFFLIKSKYKISKKISKKEFYQNGFSKPRIFYYYSS